MITGKIVQTYQGLSAQYQILSEDGSVTEASVPYNVSMGSIYCNMPDGAGYGLRFDFSHGLSNWTKELEQREYARYRVEDVTGREAGYVCLKRVKGLFSGYPYHEVSLDGQLFHIYGIGLGKEGKKYPLYLVQGNQELQVGQLHKPCVVENMRDVYEYRVVDKKYAAPIILYTLYEDLLYNGNRGKIPMKSKEVTLEVTLNKKLKEKYDPNF